MARRFTAMLAVTGLALGLLGHAPARADQADPRLDRLFARLNVTKDPGEVAEVTREIWTIWRATGIPALDWMMRQSSEFMQTGALETALGGFTMITDSAPDFAEGWHKRATVYYLMGDYAQSIESIEKAVDLEPRHFGAYAGLGLIYLKMGKERAALRALERALAINPHLEGTRQVARKLRRKLNGKKI